MRSLPYSPAPFKCATLAAVKHPPILPPPPDLDLGDLASVKPGDEVVTVCPSRDNEVGATVYLVHKLEGGRVSVRRPDRPSAIGSWLVTNHGGTRGMYGPVFYYSANPAHIARAKERNAAIEAEEARQKAAREALLRLARPIGRALGDGNQFDGYGESYESESVAETLADKLTADQLATLAGWLGLGDQP